MRWERLFQDLEDQIDRETDAELEDLARDEERLRIARLSLIERVRDLPGGADALLTVAIAVDRLTLVCEVIRCGRDWMLVQVHEPVSLAGTSLMPISAVRSVRIDPVGVGRTDGPRGGATTGTQRRLTSDIGFTFVLRDLCRRRRHVILRCDDTETSGTIERVGKDHLDIAVHAVGLSRNTQSVSHIEIVPLARVDLVYLT